MHARDNVKVGWKFALIRWIVVLGLTAILTIIAMSIGGCYIDGVGVGVIPFKGDIGPFEIDEVIPFGFVLIKSGNKPERNQK